MQRNRYIVWRRAIHNRIVNICLALDAFRLTPYELLWIFDWLPLMYEVIHFKKIRLIDCVLDSIRKTKQLRNKVLTTKKPKN